MGTVKSFPQVQYHYVPDSTGLIKCGSFTINSGVDVNQINVACYLDGNFVGKSVVLNLQSTSDPARTFNFVNKDLNFTGSNFCYVSFVTENFHAKDSDTYEASLFMTPALDANLFAIADFTPENNTPSEPSKLPAVRFEIYET